MSKIENINDKTMAINSKYMLSKKVKCVVVNDVRPKK